MWEDGKPENNNGKIISKYLLNQSNLILATPKNLGTRPSHNNTQNSTIDLTFTSPALGPTTTIHLGPHWSSDHLPIIININTDLPPTQLSNPNWRFNEEKWEEWNEEISKTLITNKLSNATSPESAYSLLYSSIIEASQTHFTPNRNAMSREKPKPWWTPQCKKATSMVRRAYNKWRSSLLQSDKTELNRLEAIKKKTIIKAKNDAWEKFIGSLDQPGNTTTFWNFAKFMLKEKRTKQSWPTLVDQTNRQLTDNLDKANAMLDQLCPNNNHPEDDRSTLYLQKIQDAINNEIPHPINSQFNFTELKMCIKTLPNKAMGADRLHNKMLSKLSDQNLHSLLFVLNYMFRTGYIPEAWKHAVVTPILKPGKPPERTDSYRPISLTSCLAKIQEKIINNRLKWYLDKNAHLPKHQTGFRRGYTTTDNLIRLEEAVSNGFFFLTAVFLDLAKAYDDTWLTGLLYKITKFNIRGVMLNWLSNFLTNRTVNVKIEDSLSNTQTMNKGVPQGCVLSPILFNIIMADFPLPDPRINLALFADDILIYTTSPTKPEAERTLQR
jgi:hypothetical protein